MQIVWLHKARLHTTVTRTGQRTPLPCPSETIIHIFRNDRAAQKEVPRFRFSYAKPRGCERDVAIGKERDGYVNIMTVPTFPPVVMQQRSSVIYRLF